MSNKKSTNIVLALLGIAVVLMSGCRKQASPIPVASLNVVNALPTSAPLILVQGSITPEIGKFLGIGTLPYASTAVLTAPSGAESFYVVQQNADTTSINAQGGDFMFNSTLNFIAGGIYSLFITGVDTTSPDFLFVRDVLPVIKDSSVGIRFVNLSTGSNPISINLEGSQNGSEVTNLPYKNITSFKQYTNNSTTIDYLFVVRDATTGDSLTQFDFLACGSSNNGNGLTDPSSSYNNGTLLTFKNVTIAIYGSESITSGNPLSTMLIDNY